MKTTHRSEERPGLAERVSKGSACGRIVAGALLAIAAASPAAADPRIRTVTYSPDRVIVLTGHYGYQIAIEFPEPDRIESVAIGDSLSWQATPNKRGNALFLKPVDIGEPTNMTVMTADRHYNFELAAEHRTKETPASAITYLLRIKSPLAEEPATDDSAEPPPPPAANPKINSNYTYSGSRENLPSRVFDDGKSTLFAWPPGVEAPAIFVRRPDGAESIVNFGYAGDLIVVHQIAAEFILRNGKQVTTLYNDGFVAVDRGPDAPQPRNERKRGFLGLFNG